VATDEDRQYTKENPHPADEDLSPVVKEFIYGDSDELPELEADDFGVDRPDPLFARPPFWSRETYDRSMKPYALLLVGVVLLGGCLGGVTVGDGGQGGTATEETTTEPATEETTTEPATEETTTLPATTDADENLTARFVVEDAPNVAVSLLVADDPDERRQGLMYRQSLPHRTGMVFVYDDAAPRTFWMKNTYVPLDIIFVAPNGTVLNVEHAQAQPHAPDSAVDRYSSDADAMYVVELRRGFANRTGVSQGTELAFNGTAPEA